MTFQLPMLFERERLLWTVEAVYSPAECRAFVNSIESWSPTSAASNPGFRDQDRAIRDDSALAADLFHRLRPHLPDTLGPLTVVGLNPRLRFYRYRPGQKFTPHTDHWYWPKPTQCTLLTVLVYFNDDFTGGETRFIQPVTHLLVPKVGLAAVFQHKLEHEGCPVRTGTKYAMRTDVIYEGREAIVHA